MTAPHGTIPMMPVACARTGQMVLLPTANSSIPLAVGFQLIYDLVVTKLPFSEETVGGTNLPSTITLMKDETIMQETVATEIMLERNYSLGIILSYTKYDQSKRSMLFMKD